MLFDKKFSKSDEKIKKNTQRFYQENTSKS